MKPEAWLEEHGDCLYAYAIRRVRNVNAAEDLVQDTLLAAIESKDTFAGASSERTWLVGILKHKILQRYRRVVRDKRDIQDDIDPAFVEGLFSRRGTWKSGPGGWGGDPDSVPEAEEFRRALAECLFKLPRRIAEAFLLAEQHHLTTENLCQVLEVSATNVYAMLYRARSALRQCLERGWFGGGTNKGC